VTGDCAKPRVFELPRSPGFAQLNALAREKLLRQRKHWARIKDGKSVERERLHPGCSGSQGLEGRSDKSAGDRFRP
jgi:hypothetical protein